MKAEESRRTTRITADPLNIKPRAGRQEIRRNFVTVRVIDDGNRIPVYIKKKPTASIFKAAYAKLPGT